MDPVTYDLRADGVPELRYHDAVLEDHPLDFDGVPEAARSGQMRRLLCGAALGCFAGSARAALVARGVTPRALRGAATAETGPGEGGSRVTALDIRVEVSIDDAHADTFAKVQKILEKGCLITRSLAPGIAVTHELVRL